MRTVKQPHGGAIKLFEKGDPRPATAGKPPKVLSGLIAQLKKEGYEAVKPAMVIEAYEFLLSLNQDKIVDTVNDKTQPMIVRIVGKSMLDNKFGFDIIDRMLDRAHGRAQQTVNLNESTESIDQRCRNFEQALGTADTCTIAPRPDTATNKVPGG